MVLFVWSNTALIISLSAIRLIVKEATIDLINSLSPLRNFDMPLFSVFWKINFGCCNLCFKQEKLNVYFSEMFSLPSLIKLYRMSILLFTPINKPTEIINSKSNTMVASITVESLA